MNNNAPALLLLIGSILPLPALATDAQDVIDKVLELDEERRKGVNRYVVEQEVMGQVSKITFERTTVTGPDGEPVDTFRMVLPDDLLQPDPGSDPVMSQEDFEDMAQEGVHSIAAFSESAEPESLPPCRRKPGPQAKLGGRPGIHSADDQCLDRC
jgi:hypothetical protein